MKNTPLLKELIENKKAQEIASLLLYIEVPKYLEDDILRLAIETGHPYLIKIYMSMYAIKNKYQALALLSIANLGDMTYYYIVRDLNKLFGGKSGSRRQ